ncbi:uncharacterized protein [Drosophila takahashii]|uniref:uncharacterized protein n=1 Tax=Drosophila takahashii TaxID=29030 RepID=UPI001CF7FB56|nr:uncharacterized protein LOC123003151 [Drosophila takahashii]
MKSRSRLKANITRCLSWAEQAESATQTEITTRIQLLHDVWKEFNEFGDAIAVHEEVEGYVDPEIDNAIYEEKYLRAIAILKDRSDALQPGTSTGITNGSNGLHSNNDAIVNLLQQNQQLFERLAANQASSSTPVQVGGDVTLANLSSVFAANSNQSELPKIQIKRFSGNYTEWPSFQDIYENTIHNKQHLSNTQKFHYLKTLLVDEAANLVRHLAIAETAYNTAWERLKERYNRPRHIVNSFLEQFMSLPTTTKVDASILRKVSDGANEIVRGLDAVNQMGRDCWIIYLALEKLDADTRRRWIERSMDTDSPTLEEFFKFLDSRCEELELSKRELATGGKTITHAEKPKRVTQSMVAVEGSGCTKCNSTEHTLYSCQQFLDMSGMQRRSFVKEKSLCYNCLRPGHGVSKCKSAYKCRQCKGNHHSLLHVQANPQAIGNLAQIAGEDERNTSASNNTSVTLSHFAQGEGTQSAVCAQGTAKSAQESEVKRSILPTAMVYVQSAKGDHVTCRLLLDMGSELSYVSERCIQGLGLTRSASRILVTGISSVKADTTRGCSTLHIKSRISEDHLVVYAHVLGRITSSLERQNIDASALKVFKDLQLADTEFNTNSPVDILLGSEHVWSVFTGRKMYDNKGNLIAISSVFGWVITSLITSSPSNACALTTTVDIGATLQKFWELENVQSSAKLEPEDDQVEKHFLATHSRDENGKYIVELPFNTENPEFGGTLQGALKRFKSVERRLQQNEQLRTQYVHFMREYTNLGHMREVPPEKNATENQFYLPHHPVLGRKLRVVFDGSFRDANGKALNDTLFTGPSIQRDLFAVCLRFRMYKFAFSADIVKMFRQIWVNEKHRNFQKIVWREDPSDPIKHFQLCTVTYGTSCAPFLAVRVLEQLAIDHQEEYPNASKILLEDFYVDDVLTGSNSEDELLRNRNELVELMSRANLELGKWVSNTPCIQTDNSDTQSAQTSPVKVLGLYWHPGKDILTYNVGLAANPDCTKRQVLSDVSRIFDRLGLLAPIVIQFKVLFQKLWLLNLDWDDPLPTKLADNRLKWRADLDTLQKFRLPRFVPNDLDNIELHGFSDASTKAYAAVVYSRVTNDDGSISVSTVAAKTRVAPLKQQSLPRLELCAALLLSQLIRSITSGLRHKNITVFGWSDSSIVLSWLSYAPAQLKTFVGNRTSEILDTIPRSAWRHVDSKTNPADCASRGLMAADLIDFHLWWNGPEWLRDKDQYLVKLNDSRFGLSLTDKRIQGEVKSNCLATLTEATQIHLLDELIERVSSWIKLVHIVGYVMRFIQRTRNSSREKVSRALSFHEIKAARILCIKHAQGCFQDDYQLLLGKKPLKNRSQLVKLAPMIDENDLLRVGGRLHHSQLSRDAKHPVLLPKTHRISKLILEHEHRVNLHPGVSSLFVIVRQKFWIFGARNLIRKITHDCLACFRQRSHTSQQQMANLPSVRITQALPFIHTGCDYAGPILLKDAKVRKPRISKGYICLFVCMVTSAIHLELATDLTTETFLAALRRFISLRGKCSKIYSDNGTNFIGAKRSLDEMQELLSSQTHKDTVSSTLADDGIQWVLIPPRAPHWGGKWESAVRCVKLHLLRITGNSTLTFEQMRTLLAQISAVINSRPLCHTPDMETNYLSPAHFLIGRPLTTVPDPDLSHIPVGRLGYWQSIQSMLQGFWKKWHQEYLTTLQQRPKWTTSTPNISTGNVVLVKESNSPPASWHIARVMETYPGKDDLVRAVKLKTQAGEMTRPITKVAVLPHSETVFQGGPGCS